MMYEVESMNVETAVMLLAGVVSILTIVSFLNGRKKDGKKDGEKDGNLKSDLQYIKEVLLDVRTETKEINRLLDSHSVEIAKAQSNIVAMNDRINDAMHRIEQIEKGKVRTNG